jgi:hypothetical protein
MWILLHGGCLPTYLGRGVHLGGYLISVLHFYHGHSLSCHLVWSTPWGTQLVFSDSIAGANHQTIRLGTVSSSGLMDPISVLEFVLARVWVSRKKDLLGTAEQCTIGSTALKARSIAFNSVPYQRNLSFVQDMNQECSCSQNCLTRLSRAMKFSPTAALKLESRRSPSRPHALSHMSHRSNLEASDGKSSSSLLTWALYYQQSFSR